MPTMKNSWALALGMLATMAMSYATASSLAEPLSDTRKAQLFNLVRQDCGSCHGMTLKGGLGTPLLPHALQKRSESELIRIILDGIPGTPMPPWRGLLSEPDAHWIAMQLKNGMEK